MGVPGDSTRKPVAKRQRLSLKSNKTKNIAQEEKASSPAKESCASESSTSNVSGSNGSSTSVSTTSATSSTDCSTSTSTTDAYSNISKEDNRVPAVASLENLGNTCFMNSVMQVLRYTPGFLHNLSSLYQDIQASEKVMRKKKKDEKEQVTPADDSKGCWKVVKNVYKVYRDLTSLEMKHDEVATDDVMSMSVKPNRVLAAVRDLNPMFEGNMQHDAQEFLRCLLCYFQEAEKDVQKFYSHIPQKFSPKHNPIMQSFLMLAKSSPECKIKIEKIVNKIDNHPALLNNANDSTGALEADKVKTKLFITESINNNDLLAATEEVKQDVAKSENVFDLTSDKIEVDVQSKTDKSRTDSVLSQSPTESNVVESVGKQTKGKETRGKDRFKPYDKKLRGPKCAQTSAKKGKSKDKVSSQPCISDMFIKTYGMNKRLGMRGAVVQKCVDQFDDMVTGGSDERNAVPVHDSKGSVESSSNKSDVKEVKHSDAVTNRSSADLTDKKSPPEKSTTVLKESNNVGKSGSNISTEKKASPGERSFQDVFSAYLNGAIVDDSDSDKSQSDSDNEDIIVKKMREKLVKESPRRSPRKTQSELYKSSPYKASIPKSALGSMSEPCVKSAQYKLNFDDKVKTDAECSEGDSSQNACTLTSSENISSAEGNKENINMETSGDGASDNVVGSDLAAPMVLDPVVLLQNCDHVLNDDGTAVSASYASQCLTPVKHDRAGSTSGIGNYLKERNIMNSLDASDEVEIKKAILEMLNSPKKSRSKYDLIERTFQGTMMLRTRCTQCETSWERQEDFHDVCVPVRIEKSDSDDEDDDSAACGLLDLIQASTDIEKLRDRNKYQCDVCKTLVDAERSIHYDVLPDILTLHLKRFSAEIENPCNITKINDHVNIPITLPCLRYRCQELCLRPDHRYKLYGIITHAGSSLTSGHYLSYVRSFPEQSEHAISNSVSDAPSQPFFNPQKELVKEENGHTLKSNTTSVPATRRKLGVQTKLPARFNDSVISNSKLKTFQNLAPPKKSDPMESLTAAQSYKGEWFECNDEAIRVFDEAEFVEMLDDKSGSLLGTPYLLFYHKSTL